MPLTFTRPPSRGPAATLTQQARETDQELDGLVRLVESRIQVSFRRALESTV